jgi:hypothetical protein
MSTNLPFFNIFSSDFQGSQQQVRMILLTVGFHGPAARIFMPPLEMIFLSFRHDAVLVRICGSTCFVWNKLLSMNLGRLEKGRGLRRYEALAFRLIATEKESLRIKCVAPRFSLKNRFPAFTRYLHLQLRYGLRIMNAENLSFSGYGIPNENRSSELPVLTKENGARSGHIHGNQSMKKACGQTALNDELFKPGLGCKILIKMQWIIIARQVCIISYMIMGEPYASCCLLPDYYLHCTVIFFLDFEKPVL